MTCQDCIARANDFIEDALGPLEAARHARHVEGCASCSRYHHVLRAGIDLVRDIDGITPSPDFRTRLHGRLRGLDDERFRRERAVVSGAMIIAVAGLVALAAWAPIWQGAPADGAPEAFTARQGQAAELPPAASSEWWYDGPRGSRAMLAVDRSAAFPGPYSPLIVQPPMMNSAVGRPAALVYGDSE